MIKVLVADDTKNIRTLLMKCLQLEGYEVGTAGDGKEALEALLGGGYGLAFLDIKMPLISGTEVLKKIREAGISTPIIIITAYATVKNAVECTQLGAVAYLQKPFTADKVRNVLAELQSLKTMALGCGNAGNGRGAEGLLEAGEYGKALSLLKRELAERPLEPRVYSLLARASEGLGLHEDAAKYRGMCKSLENL